MQQSVIDASTREWTIQHETYARTVFATVLKYCAHPRGTMDRGPAKLNELISRIKISQYDSSIKLDDALCGAMEVDPARISLPEKAGVVDPKNHLTGQRLQDFLNMPTHTPLEFSKNRSDPACHKVSPKNWPVLLKKLYDADMITFLPKSQVLKDGNQLVKGGLFCPP